MNSKIKKFDQPEIGKVQFTDGVFAPRVELCLRSTIPSAIAKAEESGRCGGEKEEREGHPKDRRQKGR